MSSFCVTVILIGGCEEWCSKYFNKLNDGF